MTVISDTGVPLFRESLGVPPFTSKGVKLEQGLGLGLWLLNLSGTSGLSGEHPNTDDPCSSKWV